MTKTYGDICTMIEDVMTAAAHGDAELNTWEENFISVMQEKADDSETFSGDEQAKIIEIWNKHNQ